jgi:hypothetical protein
MFSIKDKVSRFRSIGFRVAGILVVVTFFTCVASWYAGSKKISLFDVPGIKTSSLRFLRAKRVLNLVLVDGTMIERDLLNRSYPKGSEFYLSKDLPILVVVRYGFVDVVRVGSVLRTLREIDDNRYVMSPDLLRCVAIELEKINVSMPYQLVAATTKEAAIGAFWHPYVVAPSQSVEEEVVCLDFINAEAPDYWPVVLYFHKNKLFTFEVKAKQATANN